MKTDIKILRIMYVIIFIIGFLLFFHYTNEKEVNIKDTDYTYEIKNIIEEKAGITYEINIDEPYSEDILKAISEEIREDYNHIYNLEKPEDKVEYFDIFFYYDYEVYRVLSNNFEQSEKISEEVSENKNVNFKEDKKK